MALTASYIAACMIAKLRVACTVAGCAPGVRTITRRVRFHCKTWLTSSKDAPYDWRTWSDASNPSSRISANVLITDLQRLFARFVPSLRSRNDAEDLVQDPSRPFLSRWCKRAGARSVPGMIDRRCEIDETQLRKLRRRLDD